MPPSTVVLLQSDSGFVTTVDIQNSARLEVPQTLGIWMFKYSKVMQDF